MLLHCSLTEKWHVLTSYAYHNYLPALFHRACSLFTCHVYQQALPRQPPQHASVNHTRAPHISSHPIISCSHDMTYQSRDQRFTDFIFGGVNCLVLFFPVLFQYTKCRVSFLSSYLKSQKYLQIIIQDKWYFLFPCYRYIERHVCIAIKSLMLIIFEICNYIRS